MNSAKVYDYIELDAEYSIFELAVPSEWYRKKIVDVNPRRKYDINILTIKKGHKIVSSPNAEYVFEDGDHMVVFGNTEKILAFTNKRKK